MTQPQDSTDDQSLMRKEHGSSGSSRLVKYWMWAVFLFVCWQPLELGFYMDDWSVDAEAVIHGSAFSGQRYRFVLALDPSRPGSSGMRFVLSSLLGDRPVLWQIAMLLANVLVAFSLARAIKAITGAQTSPTALAFALVWLILPWSTSSQFWSILLPYELLFALFAFLLAETAMHPSPSLWLSVIYGVIYLFLCTSYEILYGQFLSIILIMVGVALLRKLPVRTVLLPLVSFGVAQVLACIWYFKSPGFYGTRRPIQQEWIKLAVHNSLQLPRMLMQSMPEVHRSFYATLLTLFASCVYVLWRSRDEWAERRQVIGAGMIVAACALGAMLSVLCYSLGGRVSAGLGVDNRNVVLVSFWLVLLAGITALTVLKVANPWERKVLATMAFTCGMVLGIAHTIRTVDWATAWTLQRRILQSAPVKQLQTTEAGATVIMINRLTVNEAPIFSAPWDINRALPLTYPVLENHPITICSHWQGAMDWDGERIMYAGQAPIATTHDVYLWIPADQIFRRALRPLRIQQDLVVRDLP